MINEIIHSIQNLETYQILDFIGAIVGFVYIYQEYKASIWLWITGIIMPIIYTLVYYEAGLYADFCLQIYYIIAAIYGFMYWQLNKNKTDKAELPISRFPKNKLMLFATTFIAIWIVSYFVLSSFTNSTVPVLDSFGNSLSIIGLWALAKKYIEQWWIWIVADIELSALYIYKGLPFTSILYAIYSIIAIAGYFKWKKIMVEQKENQNY